MGEITEFLTEPSRLAFALELSEKLEAVKIGLLAAFWQNVYAALERHESVKSRTDWTLFRYGPVDSRDATIGIALTSDWERGKCPGMLMRPALLIQYLAYQQYEAYLGVHRGSRPRSGTVELDEESSIREYLSSVGISRQDGPWIAWQHLGTVCPTSVSLVDQEALCRINDDNRDSAHPIAAETARFFCTVFDDVRDRLESSRAALASQRR